MRIKIIFTLAFSCMTLNVFALDSSIRKKVIMAIANNDWSQAEEIAEDYLDENQESSEAHFLYAIAIRNKMENVSQMRAMMNLGDYKEALAEAIRLNSNNIEAREEQIIFLINAPGIAGGDKQQAAAKIQKLKPISPIKAAELQLALASSNEDSALQLTSLNQLIELQPEEKKYLLQKGLVLVQQKKFTEAESNFRDAQKTTNSNVFASAAYQRARLRIINESEIPEAIRLLEQYIADYPQLENTAGMPALFAAHWRLGLAMELNDDIQQAIHHLTKSIEYNADYKQAQIDLKRIKKL